jgi:hypothetical protein
MMRRTALLPYIKDAVDEPHHGLPGHRRAKRRRPSSGYARQ